MQSNLETNSKITWCPGCPNSQILVSLRQAIGTLVKEKKLLIENIVMTGGIGCHGKITDYMNTNSFTGLHGRVIPAMTGIKCANPMLTVIGSCGDGDAYSEGLEHLIHAARRNSDIKVFVHDNQLFALTTGQASSRSPKGFKGKSTPFGSVEEPFDPLLVMLASGASFVARTYAGDIQGTKRVMQAAIEHRGFSFVDIIQPCITFFDTRDFFKEKVYWIEEKGEMDDLKRAMELVSGEADKIPLGIFYRVKKETFEDGLANIK